MNYDLETFRSAFRENPEVMREILRLYREQAPQRLETAQHGLERGAFDEIASAAHSLANTSGTLQCSEAVSAAHSLEQAARGADAVACRRELERLEALVDDLIAQIGDALAEDDPNRAEG